MKNAKQKAISNILYCLKSAVFEFAKGTSQADSAFMHMDESGQYGDIEMNALRDIIEESGDMQGMLQDLINYIKLGEKQE